MVTSPCVLTDWPLKHGYGSRMIAGRRTQAHRAAWEEATGEPPPPGLDVCHACDNRACIRNDDHGVYVVDGVAYERWGHLWLAPRAANLADMRIKGRAATGDRHNSRTHPDSLPRGDQHWTRRFPDKAKAAARVGKRSGDAHPFRSNPELGKRLAEMGRAALKARRMDTLDRLADAMNRRHPEASRRQEAGCW